MDRAGHLELHEVKKQFIAAWIAEHGFRRAEAAAVDQHASDGRSDGAEWLLKVLPTELQREIAAINTGDLRVDSEHAQMATAEQFALVRRLQPDAPAAPVILRRHRISLRLGAVTTPQSWRSVS
jgi:hypothetical protein